LQIESSRSERERLLEELGIMETARSEETKNHQEIVGSLQQQLQITMDEKAAIDVETKASMLMIVEQQEQLQQYVSQVDVLQQQLNQQVKGLSPPVKEKDNAFLGSIDDDFVVFFHTILQDMDDAINTHTSCLITATNDSAPLLKDSKVLPQLFLDFYFITHSYA